MTGGHVTAAMIRKVVADMSHVLAADPTLPSAGWNRTAEPWRHRNGGKIHL